MSPEERHVDINVSTVGRFAPTPSGRMHLGNILAALCAWAGARTSEGRMILRIEDLDPRASSRQVADQLVRDIDWLGMDWDEGPLYQSERLGLYEEACSRLTEQGLTYPCFCTRAELHAASAPHASDGTYVYAGTCRNLTEDEVAEHMRTRPPATRLRVPDADNDVATISFDDLVCGHVSENIATECGDFLVRRSDGVFAYQLAVVVDDLDMGVTQVTRGNDLLGSVARQMYLARLLGGKPPTYAHVPLLVADDGRRLSKRDADLDLGAMREAGATPNDVVGRVAALLGLAETGEPVAADEFVRRFSWDALARCPRQISVR